MCGADFSNFRCPKRCNFSRKIRRPRACDVPHRKKSQTETALVIAWSCAAFKTALKFFATEIPRLRRQFFKFSVLKTRQFCADNFENRARVTLCATCNRACAFCCRALHLRMRESLLATDFLHVRRRFCKFSASKTLQVSAQNSPFGRVRLHFNTAFVSFSSCAAVQIT